MRKRQPPAEALARREYIIVVMYFQLPFSCQSSVAVTMVPKFQKGTYL